MTWLLMVRIGKRRRRRRKRRRKARIKVRRKHVVLTRGRWRLRVRKVRRRRRMRFFARIYRAKGREDWEESQARRLLSEREESGSWHLQKTQAKKTSS